MRRIRAICVVFSFATFFCCAFASLHSPSPLILLLLSPIAALCFYCIVFYCTCRLWCPELKNYIIEESTRWEGRTHIATVRFIRPQNTRDGEIMDVYVRSRRQARGLIASGTILGILAVVYPKPRIQLRDAIFGTPSTAAFPTPSASATPVSLHRITTVAEAQQEAMRLYPDLAISGSDFNRRFVTRTKLYQQQHPDYFRDINWPITLARQIASETTPK